MYACWPLLFVGLGGKYISNACAYCPPIRTFTASPLPSISFGGSSTAFMSLVLKYRLLSINMQPHARVTYGLRAQPASCASAALVSLGARRVVPIIASMATLCASIEICSTRQVAASDSGLYVPIVILRQRMSFVPVLACLALHGLASSVRSSCRVIPCAPPGDNDTGDEVVNCDCVDNAATSTYCGSTTASRNVSACSLLVCGWLALLLGLLGLGAVNGYLDGVV